MQEFKFPVVSSDKDTQNIEGTISVLIEERFVRVTTKARRDYKDELLGWKEGKYDIVETVKKRDVSEVYILYKNESNLYLVSFGPDIEIEDEKQAKDFFNAVEQWYLK